MNLKVYDPKDFPAYLPKLNQLYDELFSGGKGFRAQLVGRIARHLHLPDNVLHLLAQTVEFIHNASLLHDDLVDRSPLRRGKPAAWTKYTPEYAVLAGDYLLARVMVNLSSFGQVRLIQYTAEVISDLLEGEWIQDSLVRDYNLRLNQLDRVHNLKTASLFKWCLRAPFYAQGTHSQEMHVLLEELGTHMGLLFQRADDLLDFDVRNFEGKAILGDLKSGYLNSVACFLFQDKTPFERGQLALVQDLDQLQEIVGRSLYKQRLAEFDKVNQTIIDLFSHQLDQLAQMVPASSQGLIQELRPMAHLLYWRKK